MPQSARLRAADVRAVVTLTHECRDLGDAAQLWWTHWEAGVARLAGAALAVGGELATSPGSGLRPTGTADWGWENGFDRGAFLRALTAYGNLTTAPHIARYCERMGPGGGPALARTDLVADAEFYPTLYFDAIHRPMGVGHCLLSFRPVPGRRGEFSCLTLSRPLGDRRDFPARQKAVVAEAHAAVAPLVGGPLARFAEPSPAALPPRCRQVLRCLLEGDGDKRVAARLGLSRHTVNEYTERVYRHFGVEGRAELLARWVRRGWGLKGGWADPEPDRR